MVRDDQTRREMEEQVRIGLPVGCPDDHLEAAVRDGKEEGGVSNVVNYGGGAGARGIHNTDALSVSAHIYIFNGLLIWT